MYEYIIGVLKTKRESEIVLESNKIGYLIVMPGADIEDLTLEEECKIYLYHHVTQDSESLFGFSTNEKLNMFKKMISVSKVGAKTAVGILSATTTEAFATAIITDDATSLAKLPGIGKKTAQRIILEMKDKLDVEDTISKYIEKSTTPNIALESKLKLDKKTEEMIEALSMLGYSTNQIMKVLPQLDITKDIEECIKDALKKLSS